MSVTFDFCVAIRAHNGERYLSVILDELQSQVGLEDVSWEVLVVDNCSTDSSADIVRQYQAQWSSENPLRYCFEPVKGADIARRRAIQEANAPIIGFLDDDNVPSAGWVRAAIDFAESHPTAAAFGSRIHGRFEVEPPANFERIAGFFPIIERSCSVCFTQGAYNRKNMLPPGAGLVIRRDIWLACVPSTLNLKGPVGESLGLKGEDIEALMYIKRAGNDIWYNADMQIYHYIAKTRFDPAYLMRFFEGIGRSRFYTRTLGLPSWQKPLMTLAYMANDLRKITIHWLKYGGYLDSDPVLASEFELYRSSFVSPFYYLKKTKQLKK